MTKIIAISGRKQAGKSTASEYIQSLVNKLNLGWSTKIYSFADPLKQDICMNILGLTYEQCYGTDNDKNTMTDLVWQNKQLTAREAMEIIGTSIFRQLKNNVWVDATIKKIQRENPDLAIIPDCRFPNEVHAIKDYHGYVIRLDLDPFNSTATAERALDKDLFDWNNFDLIVPNKGMTTDQKNEYILKFILNNKIFN